MCGPFPGMDPWLEAHWGDVHSAFVVYIRDDLQPDLPDNLYVRAEMRVVIRAGDRIEGSIFPDVQVLETAGAPSSDMFGVGLSAEEGGVAVSEPVVLTLPDEEAEETFLEIRDADDGDRLITAIEVLSMDNKRASLGRRKYQRKVRKLRRGGVSLVEIDLLRSGRRTEPLDDLALPASLQTPYLVVVRRGWEPDRIEVHPVPLRKRLPVVPIPLFEDAADVPLDLQPILDRCWTRGRYRRIDYTRDPEPPLSADDARWANVLLKEKGLR